MADQTDKSTVEVSRKLDQIVRLLALSVIGVERPMKDSALLLSSAGLSPKEIAELLRTTPHTVSVTLSAARQARKSARQARKTGPTAEKRK